MAYSLVLCIYHTEMNSGFSRVLWVSMGFNLTGLSSIRKWLYHCINHLWGVANQIMALLDSDMGFHPANCVGIWPLNQNGQWVCLEIIGEFRWKRNHWESTSPTQSGPRRPQARTTYMHKIEIDNQVHITYIFVNVYTWSYTIKN